MTVPTFLKREGFTSVCAFDVVWSLRALLDYETSTTTSTSGVRSTSGTCTNSTNSHSTSIINDTSTSEELQLGGLVGSGTGMTFELSEFKTRYGSFFYVLDALDNMDLVQRGK